MIGLTKGKEIAIIEGVIKDFPSYLKTNEDVFNSDYVPEFTAELYFLPLVYEKLTEIWPERRYSLDDEAKLCDDIRIAFAGEDYQSVNAKEFSEPGESGFSFKLRHREWFVVKSYSFADALCVAYKDFIGVPWVDLIWKDRISPEAIVEIDNMMDDVLLRYVPRIIKMVKKEESRRLNNLVNLRNFWLERYLI